LAQSDVSPQRIAGRPTEAAGAPTPSGSAKRRSNRKPKGNGHAVAAMKLGGIDPAAADAVEPEAAAATPPLAGSRKFRQIDSGALKAGSRRSPPGKIGAKLNDGAEAASLINAPRQRRRSTARRVG
jgi:hypothetical protein